jgi:glycine/D-amino acid oxidase-like deaminating enzyme
MASRSVRFRPRFVLAIAFVAVAAHSGGTEIYEWTEADGVIHYSDDLTQVPDQYRDGVRVTEREEPRATDQAVAPAAPAQSAPTSAGPSEAELQLAAQANWREQAARLDARIAELAPEAKRCESDHINLSPGDGSRKRRKELAEAKACDEAEQALADARAEREALSERAREADVPPGWVRE